MRLHPDLIQNEKRAYNHTTTLDSKIIVMWVFALLLITSQVFFITPILANSVLIKNVHVISGENPSPQAAQNVLINNGKIVSIDQKSPPANTVIDGRGQYLIPGLIDTHVHLAGVPGFNGDTTSEIYNIARQQIPRSYLFFGFTTLLDLASGDYVISQWNTQALAPTALFCAPITIPEGYPLMWLDLQEQFASPSAEYMMFDPQRADVYPKTFDAKRHSPKALVKAISQSNAHCIKIFHETGFGPKKNLPTPPTHLVNAIVSEARSHNLPVFLHGNSQASYEFALETGVDALAHGMWHWSELKLHDTKAITTFAQRIVNTSIAVQPTIQVIYGERELFNPQFFTDPRLKDAIPDSLIAWFKSTEGQWMNKQMAPAFVKPDTQGKSDIHPKELYNSVKKAYQKPVHQVSTMTKVIAQHNGSLLFGSDTPSGPFYTQFPGINGRWEMDRWVDAGIDLKTLFQSLTIGNARILKMHDTIGSIEPGKRADLLLMRDNPLETVQAYDTIELIFLNGAPIDRSSLSARKITQK